MLNSLSSKATVAKARAIYGKRLKREDYHELLHRCSVEEIAEYLKRNTHYKNVLESINPATAHRGLLENLLQRDNFELYVKLCKFQHLQSIPFYNYLVVQQEVGEIVSSILHLNAGASEDYIATLPSYLINHASFNLLELAKARDYEDILKVLRHTPYYNIIKDAIPDEHGFYDCTKIEADLRTNYLKWLSKEIEKNFSGQTSKDLSYLIKTQLDLINVINGFRLKALSKAGADDIEPYMLHFYGRLSRNQQRELFEAADAEDYIKRFQKTYYGRQMEDFPEPLTTERLEQYAHALRHRYAALTLRQSQSAPVSVYTIVYLFQIEVQNIITIIEGIRYKAPLSYIEKLLIV